MDYQPPHDSIKLSGWLTGGFAMTGQRGRRYV